MVLDDLYVTIDKNQILSEISMKITFKRSISVLAVSFALFFQVLTMKIMFLYTFIGIIGVIVELFTLIKMKKIKYDIDLLIEELGDLNE